MPELPLYQCHKKVRAMKILAVETREDGAAVIAGEMPQGSQIGNVTFYTKPGWGARFKGTEGDLGYYVQYEDGYESWSPTSAFEDGYTLVS